MKTQLTYIGIGAIILLTSCIHRPAELDQEPQWRLTAEREPIPAEPGYKRQVCTEQRLLNEIINESAGFDDNIIVVSQSYPQIKCATKRDDLPSYP